MPWVSNSANNSTGSHLRVVIDSVLFNIDNDGIDLSGVCDLDEAVPALRIGENAKIRVNRLDHLGIERGRDFAGRIDGQSLVGVSGSRDQYLGDVSPTDQTKCPIGSRDGLGAAIRGGDASPDNRRASRSSDNARDE